jgi:hypothetical protein
MPCPEGCTLGPISLCDAGHTSMGNECCPIMSQDMVETTTRLIMQDAGLFENEQPQVRLCEEPAGSRPASMAQIGNSVDADGLLDGMITAVIPMLRRLLPNWDVEDLRCRLGEALRRLVYSLLSHP